MATVVLSVMPEQSEKLIFGYISFRSGTYYTGHYDNASEKCIYSPDRLSFKMSVYFRSLRVNYKVF